MSLPYTRSDGFRERVQKYGMPGPERVYQSTLYGAGFGTIVGTVRGAWAFGPVKGESAIGGLSKALNVMGGHAILFGGIALVYSGVESLLEATRGQADWRNGALAGLAAGSVIGLRTGSVGAAAGAGTMFCITSMCVDATSGRWRSNIFSPDGAPTNKYNTNLRGLASHHE